MVALDGAIQRPLPGFEQSSRAFFVDSLLMTWVRWPSNHRIDGLKVSNQYSTPSVYVGRST